MPIYIEDPGPPPGSGDDERLAFKEWGEASYRPVGPGIGRQEPCLVCGHPTGDCTLEDHKQLEEKTVNRARQTRLQGDPSGNEATNSNLYVVPDDVVEVYTPPMGAPTHRKSKRLVARKGEVITRQEAARLGLIPADQVEQKAVDLSAPKVGTEGASVGLQ